MSNNNSCVRTSLWRESLQTFFVLARENWQKIFIFSALVWIVSLLAYLGCDPEEVALIQKYGAEDYGKAFEFLSKYYPNVLFYLVSIAAVKLVSFFIFTGVGLRFVLPQDEVDSSWRGFFCWFGELVKKYILLFLPMLVLLLVGGAVLYLGILKDYAGIVKFGLVWFFFSSFVYFFWGFFLLFLVSPLALLRRRPVLKTSFALMKGNIWRVLWQSMVVGIVLFVCFFPFAIINALAASFGAVSAGSLYVYSTLVSAVFMSFSILLSSSYACVVVRTLIREKGLGAP